MNPNSRCRDQVIEAPNSKSEEMSMFKFNKQLIKDPQMTDLTFSIQRICNLITLITIVPKVEKLCYPKLSSKEIAQHSN